MAAGIGLAAALAGVLRRPHLTWAGAPLSRHFSISSSLSCGPAALLAAARVADAAVAQRLEQLLLDDPHAGKPVTSLLDLSHWATRAGFSPVAAQAPADLLSGLQLPAVAHYRAGHFVAVLQCDASGIQVVEPPCQAHRISHQEFKQSFSGYLLCLRGRPNMVRP